ncbi:MAG TPA: twin-arginine translocation signal domain-containing protein, partial [Halomonas sp.]|nr:twin-arginine translocation signal domain-containing protein [Halomonas sp.]
MNKKTPHKSMLEENPMHKSHNSERRRFMKTVGLGTAAAGAAAAVGHVTLAQADAVPV